MKTNEKGITLTALVVTIIVMVILAGVSIGSINSSHKTTDIEKNAVRDYGEELNEHQSDIQILTNKVNGK